MPDSGGIWQHILQTFMELRDDSLAALVLLNVGVHEALTPGTLQVYDGVREGGVPRLVFETGSTIEASAVTALRAGSA